jgi:acetyl esterase/lipase
MAPALPQHLDLATGFRNSKLGEDCAVVVLEYALASERRNHYPTQLRQAAYLLRHLLHVENVPPASITLVGDSAGGNLLLGLLLHITHPNPAVPVVSVNGRFARAAVISPWLELGVPSFSSQKVPGGKQDIITPSALTYWARNLLADGEADPWNSPLSAPRDWWGDLPVDDVLVTYGGSELFRDDVARLVEMLRSEFPRTMTVAACEGEIHVHMLMNRFLKIRKPCQSEDIFVTWMEG